EARISEVFEDLSKQLSEKLAVIEQQAVQLAIEVSRKIVDTTVEIQPEYLIEVIREGLKHTGAATISKIRVSPQDMEFINVIGISKQFKEHDGSWSFEADDSIRSGCVIETSAGEIDYRLDEAWKRVQDSVLKVIS
ncbi:MAG: hypothetical protein KDD53_07090, partial [Bdellovibrionales bacterium]|nr:hypothetical protein [Bdellovibrionales bacterium]